jgi:hypothetical protein
LLNAKSALPIVGMIGRFFEIPYASTVATGISALLKSLEDINELARLLHTQIETTYSEYEDIYIIAHSMGGLIAQKYIVDRLNNEEPLKIKKLMLYDVPHHGSALAKIATFYKHEQIKQLTKSSEFITELNRRREFKQINEKVDTKYIVCLKGVVVDTVSATNGYNEALELERTHKTIVKPENHEDEVYLAWKNFIFAHSDIVETLFQNLSKPNPVPQMVIIKSGINRYRYISQIQNEAEKYYRSDIYHLALPIFDMPQDEYFKEIAELFGSRSKQPYKLRKDIIKFVENSRNEVFLLITDFENDTHLDDFAKLMRSILDVVGRKLHVITIGGEKLENLKTNMGINSYFNYFNRVLIDK